MTKGFINTRAGKLINRKSTYHLHGGTKESHASLFFEIRTRNLKKYEAWIGYFFLHQFVPQNIKFVYGELCTQTTFWRDAVGAEVKIFSL